MSGLFEPADCQLDSGVNAICREKGVDGKQDSTIFQPWSQKTTRIFLILLFLIKGITMKNGENGVNAMELIVIH